MPKLSELVKSIPLLVKQIAGAVLLVLLIIIVLSVRSCVKAKADVPYWQGVAAAAGEATAHVEADLKLLEKRREQDRKDFDREINLRNGEIDSLNTIITNQDHGIAERNGKIEEQKKALALAGTDKEKVKIQAGIIKDLEKNVADYQAKIHSKDEIIFNLTSKYEAAAVRINNLEADISKITRDVVAPLILERDALKKANLGLGKQVAWLKLTGGTKTILGIVGLGVGAYAILKK
jgi:peptidoglycan hydrolase CwlO-like protein